MENDAVELEALRKEDSSWHPCQISLSRSPSGVSLIVECKGNDSNHIILHKEEVLKCVRVRSLHLQGDDCFNIKQGDHILATQNSQAKNLFFDAVVEKVICVRHSKRIHCRCTFMVKWLHQDFKEAFIVPSTSIMKLSTKSMNLHPTVSKFFNMVKDKDSESDPKDSLEKQIDDGSSSIHDSKNKSKEQLVCGVEVDTKGQVPLNQNPLKRSTRSKNKPPPTDIKVNPLPSPTSIQEEPPTEMKVNPPPAPPSFLENRPPLNPLAARAALASLISKLPRNLEFSNHKEKQKCLTNSSHVRAQKQVNMEFLVKNSSMIDNLCSKIDNENETIVKSLFCASIKKVDSKEMKLSCGTKKRLTRSRAHKEEEIRANESTKEISECDSSYQNVERNKKSSSDKRRLTRSSGRLETENSVTSEVIQGLGENKVNENVKSDLYFREEKKLVFTPLSEESNLPATEEMNKKRKKANAGNVESDEVVKRKSTSSTKLALRSSPRFSPNKL